MSDQRERLTELLKQAVRFAARNNGDLGTVAQYLLQNGLTYKTDGIELAFARLGKFGERFLPRRGCDRGPIGPMGWPGNMKFSRANRLLLLTEDAKLEPPVCDEDGNIWYPVLEDTLNSMIDEIQGRNDDG